MNQYSPTNFLSTSDKVHSKSKLSSYTQENSKADSLDYQDDHSKLRSSELKPVTKTIKKGHVIKRNYVNISNELRLDLIEAVHKHDEKIKYAAKRLGINYSAAKAICQLYKREGRSNKKTPRRVRPKEMITYNVPESVLSLSPAEDPLELCGEDKGDTTDPETNQTVSTKDSLGIVKGMTSDSSISIHKSEGPVRKPESLESRKIFKVSLPYQAESLDYEVLKQIKQAKGVPNFSLENVYSQHPRQELDYHQPISQLPIQPPSIYSMSAPNTLLPMLPPTASNQLHSIFPQGMNLLNSQINGMPLMINNPPLYKPSQNLGMPLVALPQSLYQNLLYMPRQPSVWNNPLGNFPYNMQNFNGKP